jgi:nucleoside-diphosphate-sugar epimerase
VKRVIVTGASGFIGRTTLSALLPRGFEVHAVSRHPPPANGPDGVRWITGNLLDPAGAEALIQQVGPTHLLHLAWYAEPGEFWRSTENLRWVEASLRLIRAFAAQGGRRAVVAGSCAEYEWTQRLHCAEGRTPCHPATLYGASKYALHLVIERYAAEAGLSLGWGRVFFVFGPGESPARLGGSVARSLVLDEPAPLSHGEQVRDFLYVGDLGEAFVALLDSPVEGAVNLASGRAIRIRDLAEALAAAAGRTDLLRFGVRPSPPGEPDVLTAEVRRLREEVGWSPSATLEERAADTISWWQTKLTADVLPRGHE